MAIKTLVSLWVFLLAWLLKTAGRSSMSEMGTASSILVSSGRRTTTSVMVTSPLIWATSGGGWRSMMADVGYANVFAQAGLLPREDEPGPASFTAMSCNSGGAWFTLQFFFSSNFYRRAVDRNTTHMQSFVVDWMNAFVELQRAVPSSRFCQSIGAVPGVGGLASSCNVYAYYGRGGGGGIGGFMRDMMEAAAQQAYSDAGFSTRRAKASQRIAPFRQTDLFVHMTLAANARKKARHRGQHDTITYLGPRNASAVYAVPLPMQYVLYAADNSSAFRYGVVDPLPFRAYVAPLPNRFRFVDWQSFYLYPGTGGNRLTKTLPSRATPSSKPFVDPFSGSPNVAQLAAAAGSFLATFSGLVPSYLAQRTSVPLATGGLSGKAAALVQARALYQARVFEEMSLCAQWPQTCGDGDYRLIDGGFTDGPSLAMTMGQVQKSLQQQSPGSMGPIKVILTNNNYYADTNTKPLSYFSTPFNRNVPPGEFIWAPGTGATDQAQNSPWLSPQIFANFMNDTLLLSAFEGISDTNLTTAVYRNLTTVDNAAFGIRAGFTVDLLLLQINSNVSTVVVGVEATEAIVQPLADLAATIAQSPVLLQKILDFIKS